MPIRILIADDHSVVRQGLRMFLALDAELEVIGEAPNGAEAVRMALELKPDVVLMDMLMPVMDGVTATGRIRTELPDTEVIALTSVSRTTRLSAVKAGRSITCQGHAGGGAVPRDGRRPWPCSYRRKRRHGRAR
jgi:DNA-binding NarL/FixJ family response regulator